MNQTRAKLVFCGDDPGETHLRLAARRRELRDNAKTIVYRITDVRRGKLSIELSGVQGGGTARRDAAEHSRHSQCRERACAAVALGIEIGLPSTTICAALENFAGSQKTFEICYETPRNLVVDDYGAPSH